MLTDIEIAQGAKMKKINEIAQILGIEDDDLEQYGQYKAKLSEAVYKKFEGKKDGKLILVTAVNPTPAGEGKTTVSVGLTQAMAKGNARTQRTFTRSCFRHKGRCSRWRLFTGSSYGGYKSPFYR